MNAQLLSNFKQAWDARVKPLVKPGVPGASVQDDGWELSEEEVQEFLNYALGSSRQVLQAFNIIGRWVRSRREIKVTKEKALHRVISNIIYQCEITARQGHPLRGWSEERHQHLLNKFRRPGSMPEEEDNHDNK